MLFRPILPSDFDKKYNDLLSEMHPSTISKQDFLNFISKNPLVHVLELDNKIVATGTLYIEQKLIHNLGRVGHIEDIIVHPHYRNEGIAKGLVEFLVDLASENGCYKVILECKEEVKPLYEKCGFFQSGVCMRVNLL